ncbi:MAG: hypothetical protein E6J83_00430, partial [Deltaproteobacteria bacterium]
MQTAGARTPWSSASRRPSRPARSMRTSTCASGPRRGTRWRWREPRRRPGTATPGCSRSAASSTSRTRSTWRRTTRRSRSCPASTVRSRAAPPPPPPAAISTAPIPTSTTSRTRTTPTWSRSLARRTSRSRAPVPTRTTCWSTWASPRTSASAAFSCELRRCKMHYSALGFSGTQGTSVWMHDNDFYDNALGISFDSENDHPNFPERKSLIENNLIHDNNFDIYAADSDRPPGGPAYSLLHYPVGTGAWVISGQSCTVTGNRIWNNHCFGTMLFANPLEMATSDGNQQTDNIMGAAAGGANGTMCGTQGVDFWWDESGTNNCWQDNGAVTSDPATLPGCSLPNAGAANPLKDAILASCLIADPSTGQTLGNCPFGTSNQAPYLSRDQAECGNGIVDLGEDCDPGYPAGSLPETCETLGHGPGTLGCPTVYDSASSAFLCL